MHVVHGCPVSYTFYWSLPENIYTFDNADINFITVKMHSFSFFANLFFPCQVGVV